MIRLDVFRNRWTALVALPVISIAASSALAQKEKEEHGTPFTHPEFTDQQIAFFEKEIEPILADNCYRCHGGNAANGKPKVKSGFQIISRAGLLKGGEHGPAYNKAEPAKSLVLEMISYSEEDFQMPPKGKLPQEKIDLLTKWVEMGMPWTRGKENVLVEVEDHSMARSEKFKDWWSYQPIVRPEVPKVADPRWQKNPIDAFVYADLAKSGLKPNEPAPRQTLIRRASYNLTGLGPSPKEVSAFALDRKAGVWSKLIDGYLDSPRYGEKWARHWLDLVRFAESNGFERDSDKPEIWRYRQYVIDAFNSDKPYDRFIMEQLAGDELDEVTADSMIATGFHRLMQWDDEPADRPQAVYDVLDDNVRTTSEVFLAMTLGCARCHDHKGEPITQKDYYNFMSFFHNVTPYDKRRMVQEVTATVADPGAAAQAKKRTEQANKVRRQIAAFEHNARKLFVEKDEALRAKLTGADGKEGILVPASKSIARHWEYTFKKPAPEWMTVGYRPTDWKRAMGGFGFKASKHGMIRTSWTGSDIWLRNTFRLTRIPSKLILEMYHDEDAEIYINGELVKEVKGHVDNYVNYPLPDSVKKHLQTGRNVIAVHCKQTGGGQFIDLELREDAEAVKIGELIATVGGKYLGKRELVAYHALRKELAKIESVKAPKPASSGKIKAMIVQERGTKVADLHVHIRGSCHAKGDQVEPAYPSVLNPPAPVINLPKNNPKSSGRRRALAEWIASKKNPRTARVMMNRLWQVHFGRGIVPSTSDFGGLGELPSNPKLLDWLAAEFMAKDWSIKEMQRVIMNTRTYVMSSRGQDAGLEKDPQNVKLWRFNMRRLSAEEIRDSVLGVSGKLNLKTGGPSFFEPLEEAVLATSSTKKGKWGNSPVEETLRRSVYMKLKRSLVPPIMQDFDVADTDSTCAVRFVTTVPAQALNTLNSRFFNQQAKFLAERLEQKFPGKVERQIRGGLELALSRSISDAEIKSAMEMMKKLETQGKLTPKQSLERFCLLVYNLNEFMYLD